MPSNIVTEDKTKSPRVKETRRAWLARIAPFQAPSVGKAVVQLASTVLPYFAILAAMYLSLYLSVWLTLLLVVPAAGLVVRIFIIQHDCGHDSFFRSHRANELLGRFCSLITLTPFANWRRQHANHHAVWNNLDRRSEGADIYSTCLTVAEYNAMSPFRRWIYRAVRHPLIAQLALPPLVFIVLYRVPFDTPAGWRRERMSVYATDAAVAVILGVMIYLLGVWPVVLVQVPIMVVASIIGVWIFSVQHRFEQVQWLRQSKWDAATAAMRGSSYLRLPRILQWFTGNIGFHHLHHLAPRVPNYRLAECHTSCPEISSLASTLSFWQALRAPHFVLWDEGKGQMVRFADA